MKRKLLADLIAWKSEKPRKPLLLKGVRQAGKTYLLKEFGTHAFPQYHYFNFEKNLQLNKIFEPDLNPLRIIDQLGFHSDKTINIEEDLVIFDEIQACPNALTSLKYFQEDLNQLHICAAGSLLGIHLTPVSFPVGKVSFLTLRPMSFEEFLMADGDQKSLNILDGIQEKNSLPEIVHDHLWTQLKHYFIVGGMPEAVTIYCANKSNLSHAFSKVRDKQEDIKMAYYADFTKHSGKVNAMHIDRVFKSVPSQLQSVQDASTAKFKFKGVVPGVSHYDRLVGAIDWLEAAGLVLKVSIVNSGLLPFKAYAKESQFKLLLFDVGMLGSMSGLSPKTILDYDYGTYKGYFAENFVAQEFLCSGIKELFSWTEKTAEIEFLIEDDGKVIPVEVKSGSITKTKSLSVFTEKYQPPYQMVLSAKPLHINAKNGIRHYPLYLSGCYVKP